jgi:hypothetical protein
MKGKKSLKLVLCNGKLNTLQALYAGSGSAKVQLISKHPSTATCSLLNMRVLCLVCRIGPSVIEKSLILIQHVTFQKKCFILFRPLLPAPIVTPRRLPPFLSSRTVRTCRNLSRILLTKNTKSLFYLFSQALFPFYNMPVTQTVSWLCFLSLIAHF